MATERKTTPDSPHLSCDAAGVSRGGDGSDLLLWNYLCLELEVRLPVSMMLGMLPWLP